MEVRQANIDFFSSSKEIFLFSKFKKRPDLTLVIVCENEIQQSVARELLIRVKVIINNSELMESRAYDKISESKERKIQDQIEKAANSLVSVDYQVKAAEELVDGDQSDYDVDQLLIYNYYKDQVFYHYHHFELNEDDQLKTLNALIRNLIPTIKDCHIGQNFDFITIESFNSILVIYKSGTDLTVVISKYRENINEVKDIPFKLMSMPEFSVFMENFNPMTMDSKYKIAKGDFKLERGNTLMYHVDESINNAIATFEDLLLAFKFEDWHEIIVYPSQPAHGYLKISKSYTRDIKHIELYGN